MDDLRYSQQSECLPLLFPGTRVKFVYTFSSFLSSSRRYSSSADWLVTCSLICTMKHTLSVASAT